MKLYVDDIREVPDDSWTLARTVEEAIAHLQTGEVTELSLDHDMGIDWDTGDDLTTRPIVKWMIDNDVWPAVRMSHSANPFGAKWLEEAMRDYGPDGPGHNLR